MQTANYLTDISCNLSEIDCNLSTTSSSTTTDKLNSSSSSSSFLITDILASNNEIVHLTNDNQSTDEMISVQNQNRQQYDNENVKRFQYDNDISMKLFTDYHDDNNNNNNLHTNIDNIHVWQLLFESLLTNSSLNIEQLESLLSLTRMSQNEFSNLFKEKIQTSHLHQETFQYLPFELSQQYQQLNESIRSKSPINLNDIHSLKQLSQEIWRSFQETSINNNNNDDLKEIENHSITNYNEQQLNHQNKFKLFLTKSYEQYCRQTMNHLKQTENSIINTDNKNNNDNSTDDIHFKNKTKKREEKQENNCSQEGDLNISNLDNVHLKHLTKIDKIKTYQIWFNSINCLNIRQKLYNLYKTNYLMKNYCQDVENFKMNENYSLKSTNIVNNTNNNTNTTNSSNDSSNNSNASMINNNDNDNNNNSDIIDSSNINNLSIPSNSALDALIHMTTSTMQQLKHDGDFSDELHESSTIQFYNKVSQTRKRRKTRTTFSNCQLNELENNFNRQRYLTPTDRDRIAKHLGLTNTQVITWFQNRRAKLKREAEELERDVMALRKQKQQKFTCLSLSDHNHNETVINNEDEQGDNDDDDDDNDDDDDEEDEQEQEKEEKQKRKEETSHKIQYIPQSPPISSLKHLTSSTLNTHETLNMNMFVSPFNEFTNESLISDKLLNEKCLKRNKDLSEQQFHLLNHHINNYCNNNSNNNNRKNNIDGINKGRSFKKCNKIWCPALELEQEIS
ncbi:unnamed protein product [Schistosoma spindalis]|nr:unnamed protein product [Schistosoma spindale]